MENLRARLEPVEVGVVAGAETTGGGRSGVGRGYMARVNDFSFIERGGKGGVFDTLSRASLKTGTRSSLRRYI